MADPAWLSRQIHTWHVEQVAPFNPPTQAARAYRLERLANPDPLYCRYLYAAVGFKWVWYERLAWSKADWQTVLTMPTGTRLSPTSRGPPLATLNSLITDSMRSKSPTLA